jgi:site-specific DNA-methyltransferase (adenine-specific)
MALQKAMVSSKTNEWETPQWFFDKLNKEFNFTLDPCCKKETAKCNKFFTEEEDGLKQDWSKDIVFMNPPYGGNTGKWIRKAWLESRNGATIVCLIVSSTDRSYWHDYIFPFASEIRFIRGRLRFGNAESTAPFASAIIIFDNKPRQKRIVYSQKSINDKLNLSLEI